MKMKTRNLIITGAASLFVIFLYWIFFTTPGSKWTVDKLISRYIGHESLAYRNLNGNLIKGITFRSLELKSIKDLPEGTSLRTQRLFVNVTSLGPKGILVEIDNARLRLPESDPIVISGSFKDQQLDAEVYSNGFTVNEVLAYLPDFKKLVPIRGDVRDIVLRITGNYLEPTVRGRFSVARFVYKGFLLQDAPFNIDVVLKDMKSDVKLYGNVYLEKGELQTNRVSVKLEKGDLRFSGPWNDPRVNFKGISRVEKTKINISLTGTIEKPNLTLTSEPSFSQQKLMVMLATGKSWQGIEGSVDNGFNSAAITKDFIDYFLFAGKSNQFAKRFGISEFSVKYEGGSKGVAAKKEISDKLEVGYGVEQSGSTDQAKDITQKLEGAYKVTENMSVGVEREIKQKQAVDDLNAEAPENNDKVLLKYKRNF